MTSFIREKGPRLVETGYPVVPESVRNFVSMG